MTVQGEATATDNVDAEFLPWDLARIIDGNGYTNGGIFNVDKMGLFLKKMPPRAFITKEEETMLDFKPKSLWWIPLTSPWKFPYYTSV
jgi:hypothetical protein